MKKLAVVLSLLTLACVFKLHEDTEGITTVLLEASNQPFNGKLGVAEVIRNRARERNCSISQVVHAKGQFSCYKRTKREINEWIMMFADPSDWREASRAWYLSQKTELTEGATFFQTKKDPTWYAGRKLVITLGDHQFFKLVDIK